MMGVFLTVNIAASMSNWSAALFSSSSFWKVQNLSMLLGLFNPDVAQSACTPCPVGSICTGTGLSNFTSCPPGYYCPQGSAAPTAWYPPWFFCFFVLTVPAASPASTFSNQYNIYNVSACQTCLRGQYCASTGLTAPSGPCIQGFL